MSKVEILRLDSVTTNDTKATALINTNFQNIQNVIETLLSRTGATPNYMDAVLDMNSYRIINTAAPVEDFDVVNLKYLKDYVGNLESLVNQALEAAEAALVNAQNAAGSANVAASASQTAIEARDAAVDAAILAQGIERDIEGLLNDPNLVAVGEDLRDPDGKINTAMEAAQALLDGEYGCGLEFESSYLQLLDKNGEALGDPVLINQGNYKGEYSATTTYQTGDYVHYSSPYAFYMCQSGPATGIAPEGDPLSRTTWISGNRTHVEPASNNASYHIALAGDPYIQYPDSVYLYASENAPKINASTGDIIGYAKTSDLPDTSDFVTTNTAQTITSQKTFSSVIRRSSTIDQSATTGSKEVRFLDELDSENQSLAYWQAGRSTTTNTASQRVNNKNVSGANWASLNVSANDAGQAWASINCGSGLSNRSVNEATNSQSSTIIATMGWVNNPNYSQNVMHRTGTETATGNKTFSGTVSFTGTATATTQAAGDNSTKLATTAYVDSAAASASNFKGQYDSSVTYHVGDYVWWTNTDQYYICKQDTTGNAPNSYLYWSPLNDTYEVKTYNAASGTNYNLALVNQYSDYNNKACSAYVVPNGPYVDGTTGDIVGYQKTANLVTSVDSTSTDDQYPSAKLFYDTCGDIETLINAL